MTSNIIARQMRRWPTLTARISMLNPVAQNPRRCAAQLNIDMTKGRKNKYPDNRARNKRILAQEISDRLDADTDALKQVYRDETGDVARHKHLRPEDVEKALLMISQGQMMRTVTEILGVTAAALHRRAAYDSDLAKRLNEAKAAGAWAWAEHGTLAAMGVEGFSKGSVARDRLIYEATQKWAKTLNQQVFGDKVQVDTRSISITVSHDAPADLSEAAVMRTIEARERSEADAEKPKLPPTD